MKKSTASAASGPNRSQPKPTLNVGDTAPAASIVVDNLEFTNLPRKFNVTITGCLENCCHTETQDIALVPAYRELDGRQVNGFNVLVGGKQGSGGYQAAQPLDVFVAPDDAAAVCQHIVAVFRDHGSRGLRTGCCAGQYQQGDRGRGREQSLHDVL